MTLNKMIDHTKLGAAVTRAQIDVLLAEAVTHDFKSVCVNPIWVTYAASKLASSDVLTCTVIGFPHGTHTAEVKAYEAMAAIKDGADELDMVLNIKNLKEGHLDLVEQEIKGVVDAASGRTVKVILETCYLTDDEIVEASKAAVSAGAHFVKTSTGFGTHGATVDHVRLMKKTVGNDAEVKASGGVRTYDDAMLMIEAGATRIGTSNGVAIVTKRRENNDSNTTY